MGREKKGIKSQKEKMKARKKYGKGSREWRTKKEKEKRIDNK